MISDKEDIGIEEFSKLGKYDANVNRSLKVTLQNTSMVEVVLRNAKKIKQSEEWKNVWVSRCLNKEDREKLKEKVEEAEKKNAERSEEASRHFFNKVIEMQVEKIYIQKRKQRSENTYKNEKLTMLYSNVDGLVSKLNEIKDFVIALWQE